MDTIKICGVDFKVIYKSSRDMPMDLGSCHTNIQELWVNESNTEETSTNVILHEVIHALSDMYDLDMTERQVNVLTTVLIGFSRDNPQYSKMLFMKKDVK